MYITVLDFTEGRVFQYNVTVYEEDYPSSEQIEDFLSFVSDISISFVVKPFV